MRLGGYVALIAFLVVGFATARYGSTPGPDTHDGGSGVLVVFVFLLLTGYAAGILRLTARTWTTFGNGRAPGPAG